MLMASDPVPSANQTSHGISYSPAIDDPSENGVDDLLAVWTTLPMSARSRHGGSTVLAS